MLPPMLLHGLKAVQDPRLPGIYFVADHRDPRGSSRVISDYTTGTANKRAALALARLLSGRAEDPAKWEVHHVVEAQDYADVDAQGLLLQGRNSVFYRHVMPCVLIHGDEEHRLYSRLLQSKGSDKSFAKGSGDIPQRSRSAMAKASNPAERAALRRHVATLIDHYRHVYEGDAVLTRLAANLLTEALSPLGRPAPK